MRGEMPFYFLVEGASPVGVRGSKKRGVSRYRFGCNYHTYIHTPRDITRVFLKLPAAD